MSATHDGPRPQLRICPGGPMLVRGAASVTTDDGRVHEVRRPVIGRTYPLGQTAEAIGHVAAGHARGTLVIAV